jgi:hypothetical protein
MQLALVEQEVLLALLIVKLVALEQQELLLLQLSFK